MSLFISQVTLSSNFETIPPPFPRSFFLPQVFYVGLLRTFRFVCLKRSTTASWFLTTPPVCCLSSASSIDSLGYFWHEASSRWRNSCLFRTELSLSHFIVRRLSSSCCTLSPWAHLTLPTKWAFGFPTKISIFSSRLLELFCVWIIAKSFWLGFPKCFTSQFAKSVDKTGNKFWILAQVYSL